MKCKFYGFEIDYLSGEMRYVEVDTELSGLLTKDNRAKTVNFTVTAMRDGKEIVMIYKGDYAFQFPTAGQQREVYNNLFGVKK